MKLYPAGEYPEMPAEYSDEYPARWYFINSDDQRYNCFHFSRANLGKEEAFMF